MARIFIKKSGFAYATCILLTILTLLFLKLELNNELKSESKNGEQKEETSFLIKETNAYDSKIKGIAKKRLGYAIEEKFQVKPKPWQDILAEAKEHQNSQKTREQVTKILMYGAYSRWNYSKCNKNPEFKCEFINSDIMKNTTFKAFVTRTALDVIVQYRDFAHVHHVQSMMDDVYKLRTIKKIPKLFYVTFESPYPLNGFDIQIKSPYEGGQRAHLASYWRGSDIYTPYDKWEYFDNNITSKPQERNYAEGRTKMAAIVVSNCGARNNRMSFVKELQKYIDVDIFGTCGRLFCDKVKCFEEIKKYYKFYLAFENANCRDYITEKLVRNAYKNDLLPIVLGAHPSDYKAIAPSNSYIHIEDFDTIKKLADHLRLLHQNDTLYNEYFSWKGTGEFHNVDDNFVCEICAYSHLENLKPSEGTIESSFLSWNLKENEKSFPIPYFNKRDKYKFSTFEFKHENELMCLKPDQWYWN